MTAAARRRRTLFPFASITALVVAGAVPRDAQAAGLYFSDRGVRPMGRGGAFVAGADDLGAIWYNPAGLADAGTAFLVDASWLNFSVTYTRELLIADADGTLHDVPSPTVKGATSFLPLPTIAASYDFGAHHEWTIAGGLLAPYVALASYPSTVVGADGTPQPSPARYALGSFDGSLLALPGVWVAWRPFEQLRIGLGAMALVGKFVSTVTFSACPQDRLLCAPEQPEFDANAQISVGPIIAPTANGGVIYEPDEHVRIGVSGQLPMLVGADGTFQVRLPTDVVFDGASIQGDKVHVSFELPAVARAGVEVRPIDALRIEAAYVREFWVSQQTITAYPSNISIDNVTGLPPKVAVPNIVIPRGFQDSNSYRLGGEYHFTVAGYGFDARAGVAYETTAVPPPYLSLSALDFDKIIASFGGGLYVGKHWRFDALYAHTFAQSVYVDPATAKIGRLNPLPGNAPFDPVNGGTYSATADLFGVGVNYRF
jgi:long-chain fatty acid transport protein